MSKAVLANPQLVRDWLRRESKTQRELAEELEVTEGHLGKILRQEVTPSLGILLQLGEIMGLDAWWELMLTEDLAVVRRAEKALLDELSAVYRRQPPAGAAGRAPV
jgi:transcriptional regulator with XRE-family HTH domain